MSSKKVIFLSKHCMMYSSLFTIAQAAAQHTRAHFHFEDTHLPPQWTVPVDIDHHIGMARHAHDGSMLLTAWRSAFNDSPQSRISRNEALLRSSFDSRLGPGLIGGLSPERHPSLSIPLYAACDAHALHDIADMLLQELDRLEQCASGAAPSIQTLPLGPPGDDSRAKRDLARLARTSGLAMLPTGARQFDLPHGDLTCRVKLHPSNHQLLADFFVYDAGSLRASLRRSVVESALFINQNMLRGHSYLLGMDSRQFIIVTGRIALAALDDDTWLRWLQYQLAQARDTRALIEGLASRDARIECRNETGTHATTQEQLT